MDTRWIALTLATVACTTLKPDLDPPRTDAGVVDTTMPPRDVPVVSTDPCARYATCESCVDIPECGWCTTTRQCVSGNTGTVICSGRVATSAGECSVPVDSGAPIAGCPTEQPVMFNTLTSGDTNTPGWNASLTEWFGRSGVACATTQTSQTAGPYQVYWINMPPRSDWRVSVTPAAGVDVNLAAVWQQSATDTTCAPLAGNSVMACEYQVRGGVGVTETVRLQAIDRGYRVMILVNTPAGATRGAFQLLVANWSM